MMTGALAFGFGLLLALDKAVAPRLAIYFRQTI